jgi:hypothetical protein
MPTIVQASQVNNSFPLILSGEAGVWEAEVIGANGSRSVNLAQYTIMSQVASTLVWMPWLNANLGDTTGLQYPAGIYLGDTIPYASIAAGNVANCMILAGGALCMLDVNLLVFDKGNSGVATANTLASIITAPSNIAIIAERWLNFLGLFPTGTLQGDLTEN